MSSQLRIRKNKLKIWVVTALSILAFIIQPMGGFASSLIANALGMQVITTSASSKSIDATKTETITANTSSYSDLSVSFSYDVNELEDFDSKGDSLEYGWKLGATGTEHQLGVLKGETNKANKPGPNEIGEITNRAISDTSASAANFTLYFKNTGTSTNGNQTDTVSVTNVILNGTPVPVTISTPDTYFRPYASVDKPNVHWYFGVDFKANGYHNLTSLKVQLLHNDTVVAENNATATLLATYNASNNLSTSSPFYLPTNTPNTSSWTHDAANFTTVTAPDQVKVIVTDNSGTHQTTAPVTSLSYNGTNYADVVPAPTPVDTTAPTNATLTLTGGNVVDGTRYVRPSDKLKYTVTANDDESGLDRAAYTITTKDATGNTKLVCGNWPSNSPTATSFGTASQVTGDFTTKSCTNGVNPDDGIYSINFRVYDNAGNYSSLGQETFTVDGTKPVVNDFKIENQSSTYTKSITASATVDEKHFKNIKFYITEAEETYTNGDPKCSGNGKHLVSKTVSTLENGKYTATLDTSGLTGKKYCVNAIAEDFAMNHSIVAGRTLVAIDNTAPKITDINLSPVHEIDNKHGVTGTNLNNGVLHLTFTTDEKLNITDSNRAQRRAMLYKDNHTYPLSGESYYTLESENADGTYTYSTNLVLNNDAKQNNYDKTRLRINVVDTVGNNIQYAYNGPGSVVSGINNVTYDLAIDNAAPIVTIASNATNNVLHGIASFTITVDGDNLDNSQMKNIPIIFSKGNDWSMRTASNGTIDLSSGQATFTVDTKGVGETVKPFADAIIPVGAFTNPAHTVESANGYQLKIGHFTDLAGNAAIVDHTQNSVSGGGMASNGPQDMFFRWFGLDNTAPKLSDVSFDKSARNDKLIGGTVKATFSLTDPNGIDETNSYVYFSDGAFGDSAKVKLVNATKVDTNGDTSTYTATFDTTSFVPQGKSAVYNLAFSKWDSLGNHSSQKIQGITIDNAAPAISISNYKGDLGTKTFREVSFKLHDAVAIDRAELNGKPFTSNHGSTWGDLNDIWTNKGWSGAKEGTNTLVLFDMTGNSVSYSFTIDATAPKITNFEFKDLNNGKFNPSKVIAHAEDDETFVTSVSIDTYKLVNGIWTYTYSPFVQGTPMGNERNYAEFDASNPRINQDGTYKLIAWATDKAGNVSTHTESDQFTVDHTDPEVSITSTPDGAMNNINSYKASQNVTVHIKDNNLGVTKVYKADGTEVQSHTDNDFTLTKGLPEGEYYLVHTDQATNQSDKVSFVISRTAPKIENITGISDTAANVYSGTAATDQKINFEVSKNNGSDLKNVRVAIDEYNPKSTTGWGGTQVYNDYNLAANADGTFTVDLKSIINSKNLQDGKDYVVMVQADNTAGVHNTKYFKFTVDNTAPNTPTASPDGSVNYNSAQTVLLQTNDSAATIYYTIDGTEPTDSSIEYTGAIDVKTTSTTLKAIAYDKAGNASGVGSWTYTIAPSLTIKPLKNGTNAKPTITGTTNGVSVTVNGNKATVTNGTWSYTPAKPFKVGNTTITVVSTDANGNTTSQTAVVTVKAAAKKSTQQRSTSTPARTATPARTVTITPATTQTFGTVNPSTNGAARNGAAAVKGDATKNTTDKSEVKGDSTEVKNESSDDKGCYTIFSICWYWWIPVVIVVAAIIWRILAGRNRDEETA